jgi:enoyl-CoA hydratase
MTEYTSILTEVHDHVGLIRLNRPEAYNALNSTLMGELVDALQKFDADDQIGAIVLTGNDKVFAAGADIAEMADSSAEEMRAQDNISRFDQVMQIGKPIIGAVSGWCLGGGSELALILDMLIASEKARFGQPEINLGVIPGAGGTQRMTKAVGKAIAMEMVLNNRTLTADEALHFGIVNRVLPVEEYLEAALKLAAEIAARAPLAIKAGKQAVNRSFETPLSEGLDEERQAFYDLFDTQDQKEGMQAFLEKRDPEWKGE